MPAKATLQAIIGAQVDPTDSIIHTDTDSWPSSDGLVDMGFDKHFRAHHGNNELVRGSRHVNGIVSFWNYAKPVPRDRRLIPALIYNDLQSPAPVYNNLQKNHCYARKMGIDYTSVANPGGGSTLLVKRSFLLGEFHAYHSHFAGSRFPIVALGAIGLIAALGASQVQAAPSANGAAHAVTGMDHANYHATINCGNNVQVVTPQPGTDLMPIDVDTTASRGVEAFYARAARQHVTWLDTIKCGKSNKSHTNAIGSYNWSGYQIGGDTAAANHYAQSGWYLPVVANPSSGYPPPFPTNQWGLNNSNVAYDIAIWTGLGGGANSNDFSAAHPLIQLGTDQEVHPDGTSTAYFWWQIVPQ
jgi:hypothetical protein